MTSSKLKNVSFNFVLLLLSLTFCFAVIEAALRVFYPKYQYAAESNFDRNSIRIWTRGKNSHYEKKHPDSGQPHLVYYNNLALRQNRHFSENDIKSEINIAFFGDSYTENRRLPSQYSFTEPLDYLLNMGISKFNVLNCGVDGYGTDQSFLYYRDFQYSKDLDYVFYLFCLNDLRNIYENNLFSFSNTQQLIQNQAYASPWWVRIINKFHTTYLAIDILQRLGLFKEREIDKRDIETYYKRKEYEKRHLDQRADSIQQAIVEGKKTNDLLESIALFQSLLQLWQQEIERNGGKFYIVILPRYEEHKAKNLLIDEFNVLDLYEEVNKDIDNYDYSDWKFENDNHWNEAGNQLAAIYLYQLIEKDLNLSPISTETLKEELYSFYASFDGWMPEEMFTKNVVVTPEKKENITSKYNGLKNGSNGHQ